MRREGGRERVGHTLVEWVEYLIIGLILAHRTHTHTHTPSIIDRALALFVLGQHLHSSRKRESENKNGTEREI